MDINLEKIIGVGLERMKRLDEDNNPGKVIREIEDSILTLVGELEFLEYVGKINGMHYPEELTKSIDLTLDVFREVVKRVDFQLRGGRMH